MPGGQNGGIIVLSMGVVIIEQMPPSPFLSATLFNWPLTKIHLVAIFL